jgi:hypothetical protein
MKTYLLVTFVLLFVCLSLASTVLTGNPLRWLDRLDCILGTGAFGACLSCAMVTRMPDEDELLAEECEKITWCFMCNRQAASEYATLPNGDVIQVCPDCLCHHSNIHVSEFNKRDIQRVYELLETISHHNSYMESFSSTLRMVCSEWSNPCYTCYTEY